MKIILLSPLTEDLQSSANIQFSRAGRRGGDDLHINRSNSTIRKYGARASRSH